MTIHHQDEIHIKFLAPPIIKRVREESRLWRLPLNNDIIHYLYQTDATWSEHAYIAHVTPKTHAHTVYELPSIAKGIKWIHTVCGYPVKHTWLKAIQAGNYVG